MPKVSVLMPAYNSEKYIAEAIDSILNQTFSDFEFIIINDGSTDSTPDIVKKYAKQDKRIKFIDNKKNRGVAAIRNMLLDSASGEYLMYQDSDDVSMPNRIETHVVFMDSHPDISISSAGMLSHPDNQIINCQSQPKILDFYVANCVSNPSVIMRRADIVNAGIHYNVQYSTAEDYMFWVNALKHNLKIYNIPDVLVKYRVLPNSLSHNNPKITEFNNIIRSEIIDNLVQDTNLKTILAPQHRICIFGFIPILKIKRTRIYLLEIIPLFKRKNNWWYLFDVIPFFKKVI